MFGKRRSDRRQGYSFRGHLQRVIRTKGLGRVLLSLGATVVVAATVFAHCSNTITGPNETPPKTRPTTLPTKDQTVSSQKQAIAVFPTNLLPAVHPCDPTLTFDSMQGENDITYTDQILYNSDGTPSGQHQINYDSNEKQNGRDKNGTNYAGNKTSSGQSFIITNRYETVTHWGVNPLLADGTPAPCTTTYNFNSGTTGGNCFKSSPTYDFVLVEDPITHEGTLSVTAVAISSDCDLTGIAMLDP